MNHLQFNAAVLGEFLWGDNLVRMLSKVGFNCVQKLSALELPWLENQKMKSCIPEGVYTLKARYSEKFSHHLILENVPGRNLILIHPANDAKKELPGCIAPVTFLSGIGKGTASKPLLQKLVSLCYQAFDRKEIITLTIKS